ncbi:unnamed protein product [Diatraea saccharalis]|uniref:Cadherin domain-containing protein n=1 Tax=Diatraea saccharalis TaxID=40085 RepID=A0A9N9QWV5_9NEOP|nr:unnamed protein product [Diatraea saccharalis]
MYYNGVVTIVTVGSLTLPADLSHVVLELRASNAAAVLILEVTGSDPPIEPNVIFNSESYVIEVEEGQTGTVGQVEAIADNGESVTYSLRLDNEHLQSRLSITNDGELRLSASADIGSYNFQVIATTVFTGTNGATTVYLSVYETTLCENNVGIPPLVVIDRDEEEPHHDLVTINPVLHAGCHYNLKNIWPIDQQWLYVDETGLHTYAIDREHPSIAFMALSQIKVELKLHCNTETRTKRSARQDWLGSYDYGDNTWLLGNTIEYDRKTTIVNLIVNDINDNAPIFVGKENEPIAIGYPVPDLISSISPRSLIELKATDADIGENAALMYWSTESQLAVSSSTGFVHVRNDAQLIQDMQLVVSATDLNGQGLTGTISLIIKLLDINNIAVLTVENAFLEDESIILSNLSSAVGYDVKALKSVVVSNSEEQAINTYNRGKRDVNSNGHSLQIHVYGLLQREPVLVEKLSE